MLRNMGPFRRAALSSYISQMSRPNPKVVFDDHVAEILEKQGFCWEEDPRSVYDPSQLYISLERYATSDNRYWDKHLDYGFRKAFKIFAKPRNAKCLQVLDTRETVVEALKLTKSSGLPMMKSKAESLTYSFDREEQIRKGLKSPNPCVAYKRTQQGNKTRLVWGYPLEMTIMEARFARPLIDHFTRGATPMAFGMTKCELGARISRHLEEMPGTTVCLDYSKYDSSITYEMIRRAFTILATWFERPDQERLGWKTIFKYFVFTPIVMPDGNLYTGKNHGVPSGSYFTQLVDSIVNVALVYAMSARLNFRFTEKSLYVLGDDSIFKIKGRVPLQEMISYVRQMGMTLHGPEKTHIGVNHFLGAYWEKGKPDAPIDELTKKAVYPEQFRDYRGKPGEGALDVLRNYGTSYKSAWNLIPQYLNHAGVVDQGYGLKLRPEYWSATDRFFFEEFGHYGSKNSPYPALSMRFLM